MDVIFCEPRGSGPAYAGRDEGADRGVGSGDCGTCVRQGRPGCAELSNAALAYGGVYIPPQRSGGDRAGLCEERGHSQVRSRPDGSVTADKFASRTTAGEKQVTKRKVPSTEEVRLRKALA